MSSRTRLCTALFLLATAPLYASALPRFGTLKDAFLNVSSHSSFHSELAKRQSNNSSNSNVTDVWILEDEYSGHTFFDGWTFFNNSDPTNGLVNYVDRDTAFAEGLAYVTDNKTVVMKGDNTSWVDIGGKRKSVRISSNKYWTGGLFLLDLNQAPWGCAVWPAFWTLSSTATWPAGGEIDIIEGVHDNVHNQVAWHTSPGCVLANTGNFTGTIVGQLECDATLNSNAGCGITDWSRVSYGATFDEQGGGVYAMLWDETGIAVWYFYRISIPQDILDGEPKPKTWSKPSASLAPASCDPFRYFYNHSIVFDITFCGDWAGNSYATTPGCPGTCQERLQDPVYFINASWDINSLRIYTKQSLTGTVVNSASTFSSDVLGSLMFISITTFVFTTLF